MPRYFFKVHDGRGIPDEDGAVLADISEARQQASKLAGRMLTDDPDDLWAEGTWSFEVCNENGAVLALLRLTADAI